MIKCDKESGALVNGSIVECLADFGWLAECFIKEVPEDFRLQVAMDLTKMLKIAIERATKGGEKNEKSE